MPCGKKELSQLLEIQKKLENAIRFVQQEKIVGFAVKTTEELSNGGDYLISNKDILKLDPKKPEAITVWNHEIGSKFCQLYNAKKELDAFISLQINKGIGK